MFLTQGILRAESQEKILVYLVARQSGYAREIARFYNAPMPTIQRQMLKLEEDGILVSREVGKTRVYEINPRNKLAKPLMEFIKEVIKLYPEADQNDLIYNRRRPRKSGKEVKYL